MVERLSEALPIVACIDPDAYGTGSQVGDVIDMLYFERVMFIVMAGTLGVTATLDFKVQECATSGGTFTDLTGKAITQLTQAGTDSDKQAIVEVKADEMTPGQRYLRGILTIGVATSDAGMVAVADTARWKPGSDLDLASVDEIVA